MGRSKNLQSDCMHRNDGLIGDLSTSSTASSGHSAPAASDCMQNGRESQCCEFLEFLGRGSSTRSSMLLGPVM